MDKQKEENRLIEERKRQKYEKELQRKEAKAASKSPVTSILVYKSTDSESGEKGTKAIYPRAVSLKENTNKPSINSDEFKNTKIDKGPEQ